MILYKYMSFNSAKAVIENGSIGFSSLEDLNDPFEGAALCFEGSDKLSDNLQFSAHSNRLSRKYGVLSLTRNPLNSLMWAHYGDDHRGVVVGIDADKAGLNELSKCIIPAKFGEIIYTSTIPRNPLPTATTDSLMEIGNQLSSFHRESYNLFKNAFLHKDLAWGYEEEVRVVKNIIDPNGGSRYKIYNYSNIIGDWLQIQHQGRPVSCLSIPKDSIVEAFLGCATYKNVSHLGMDKEEYKSVTEQWKNQGVDVKAVRRKEYSWNLEVSDFVV